MFRMRTLKASINPYLPFVILASMAAHAEAPSSKLSYAYKNESGTTGIDSAQGAGNSETNSMRVDFSTGSRLGRMRARANLERVNSDYSRTILTNREGATTVLADLFRRPEQNAGLGVDMLLPALTLTLEGTSSISETPFPTKSARFGMDKMLVSMGARVSASISAYEQEQPVNYYVDPDSLQPTARTTRVLEQRADLRYEQILGVRWKARSQFAFAKRPRDRPNRYSVEERLAYALGDESAVHITVGGATESRAQALQDDRGYFNAVWWQAEIRRDFINGFNLSGAFGTVVETESARGRIPRQTVGTDVVAISANYHKGRIDFGLNSQLQFSNTNYRNYQLGGNFLWEI